MLQDFTMLAFQAPMQEEFRKICFVSSVVVHKRAMLTKEAGFVTERWHIVGSRQIYAWKVRS